MSDKESERQNIPGSSNQQENNSVPPSPPAFVSLEEVMKAARDVVNLRIAHEIALNDDFKIQRNELPTNSIEAAVKVNLERAFWDILKNELSADPPCFTQAFQLMRELKEGLLDLLLPQHTALKQQILDVLDEQLIRQQAESGTINFYEYANFVILMMSRLCAPVRDDEISKLKTMTEIVPLFRGMLDILHLMKIDMANFAIEYIRPHLTTDAAISYEREKFSKFLELEQGGLERTREWLKKHINVGIDITDPKRRTTMVLNDAFLDLIDWSEATFPETLSMDVERVENFAKYSRRLLRVAAVFLVTLSQSAPGLAGNVQWKEDLKKRILITSDDNNLDNIADTVAAFVDDSGKSHNVSTLPSTELSNALKQIEKQPDHPVLSLLRRRIREFLLQTISSNSAEKMQVPPGLSILQPEMAKLAGSFLRLVSHNRAVFADYYFDIIQQLSSTSSS